ncbi:hypothetical protein [Bradyrhizobium sp. USDA 3364]
MHSEERDGLGVEALVKRGAIEARRVGADGWNLLGLLRRAEREEGEVFAGPSGPAGTSKDRSPAACAAEAASNSRADSTKQ